MPSGIYIRTKEHKFKLSLSKLAERNPMWKGKQAGLDAIHIWIRYRFHKPNFCQNCKKVPPYDLANISQKYLRDLSDWEWLCRKCHMKKDGRLEKFKSLDHSLQIKPPVICKNCQELKKHRGLGLCNKCYEKQRPKHGVLKSCIECGKEFLGDPRPHNKRCSKKCMINSKLWRLARSENAKKYIGKKNPNWKGGISFNK